MSVSFLEKIRGSVEKRVALMPDVQDIEPNALDFLEIFRNSQKPVVISEIKFASPSDGKIYSGELCHVAIASEYLSAGAAAISVLAEPDYFKGDVAYIKDTRSAYPSAHIMLKDFVLSKKQIVQGLSHGANAILLIAAFLDKDTLTELYDYSLLLGLTPIVEVHKIEELEQVLSLSPEIIGINNRNLKTLEVSLDTSRNLIKYIPDTCYAICESGVDSAEQMREMQNIGFDGFLVGSSLMKNKNPGVALKTMLMGGSVES